MKKILKHVLLSTVFLSVVSIASYGETKIPFSKWPKAEPKLFNIITVVVAENTNLACQGFCNASADDFNTTVIWFPKIYEGTEFVNTNPEFGTVNSDINIVFLDRNWNVLDIKTMKKKTGKAFAPKETFSAIEGHPEIINRIGFKAGQPFPFRIEKRKNKYFVIVGHNHIGEK